MLILIICSGLSIVGLAQEVGPEGAFFPEPDVTLGMNPTSVTTIPLGSTGTQIQDIITSADALEPVLVEFTSGTYYISNPNSANPVVALTGLTDMVIDGNGSKIIIEKDFDSGFLRLLDCDHIVVKNFIVDYSPLTFTQGIIERKINNRKYHVRISDGFQGLEEGPFIGGGANRQINDADNATVRDPDDTGFIKRGVLNQLLVLDWYKAGSDPDLFTVEVLRAEQEVAVGDTYVQYKRIEIKDHTRLDTAETIGCKSSNHIVFQDNHVNCSLLRSFESFNSNHVTYVGNQSVPVDGRGFASAAEQIAVMAGDYIWIEDNTNKGMMDDTLAFWTNSQTQQAYPGTLKDTEYFEIRNNYCSGRRHGILLSCKGKGRVVNNTIEKVGECGISVNASDIWIENNDLINCYTARPRNIGEMSVIVFKETIIQKNCNVINNRFLNWHEASVLGLGKVRDSNIIGNIFCDNKADPTPGFHNEYAIKITNTSRNLTIQNNEFRTVPNWDGILAGNNPVVYMDLGMEDESTIIFENNSIVDSCDGHDAILTFEGFETGDFSRFDWASFGDSAWSINSENCNSGIHNAKAGLINDNEASTLSVTVDCISGQVSFYYKVSSEQNYDYLRFYIDSTLQNEWSGNEDWTKVSSQVEAGRRTFEWTYSKDGSSSDGLDTAWIDDIEFPIH
jgi:hypothetical protein